MRPFSQKGSYIALMIGQSLCLLLCALFIIYFYLLHLLPDKQAEENYKKTDCFVISKKLNSKWFIVHRYRADFLISYTVAGIQYNHWVSGNGLDTAYTHNQSEEEDTLSQFEVGASYPCWYNPHQPQMVILVLRHHWMSTMFIIPIVLGIIILYFFIKNLFYLIGKQAKKKKVRR